MQFSRTKIPEVIIIEIPKFDDDRGFFMETYHAKKFSDAGIKINFIQDNHSYSKKNILRGLHYQLKFPQGKLVRCTQGEILDVAVDIRTSSPTFGEWVGEILSSANAKQLYVPPGFAHGYVVRSEHAEVEYKCTELYHPEDDYGIAWNDPDIGIDWKIENPILSKKDKEQPLLRNVKEKLYK
ncbi:MAG: dTDP-4-dehydrorhamnose 3,5-epimerase [Pelagibacterales bacterium]|nr:dTDP-4-dehydrorhamnose 3,5-epimerase [Pelagibacterales bacterium]